MENLILFSMAAIAFIRSVLELLVEIIDRFTYAPPTKFGLPYIGTGLARGNSSRIMPMIEAFADKMTALGHTVTLVEFERN